MAKRAVKTPAPKADAAKPKARPRIQALPTVAEGVLEETVIAPALSNVVGYLLRRSHNAFQSYWMATFYTHKMPITPVQGGMLVVIGSNPGLTQTELARIMNVEGPTLMQSIDRLAENGYLTRTPRIGDRRSNSLQLTAEGQKVLRAIRKFLPVRDADLLSVLAPEEIDELARLLTKIVSRAHTRLKELQEEALAAQASPRARRRVAAK